MRIDWFTPAGLSTWGDDRTIILGTKGYIDLHKYADVARDRTGDNLYLIDDRANSTSMWLGKLASVSSAN